MNIGLGVIKSYEFNIEKNMRGIEKLVKEAKAKNIDFLCFGETVLNGFNGLSWNAKEDLEKNAIHKDSKIMKKLKDIAKDNKIELGIGYFEESCRKIYDSYIILNENGEEIANYRRISKGWKIQEADNKYYVEGDEFISFEYSKKKFGVIICGDLWHDENLNAIQSIKCDYLLWPLYIDYSVEEWEKKAKKEYAERIAKVSKKTFIINSWNEIEIEANGGAYYINSSGEIIDQLPMLNEEILQIEI